MTAWEIAQRYAQGVPTGSPFKYHAYVYAACRAWAQGFSAATWRLYTGSADDQQEVLEGDWYELFQRPNPNLDGADLWPLLGLHLALRGESAWVFEGKGETLGEREVPRELYVLPGGRATWELVRDPQTKLAVGWKYRDPRTGQTVPYPWHQVLMLRLIDPEEPERGLAPLEAARIGIESDTHAASWNQAFFRNGATVGTVLSIPKEAGFLTSDQVDQTRKEFEDQHVGSAKAWRVKVVQGGADVKNVLPTHTDMEFLEQRKWSREEIGAVWGVPQFLLGLTQDLKYATARESRRVFHEQTIAPMMGMVERLLEQRLFRARTDPMERARASVAGRRVVWGAFDVSGVEALRDAYSERLASLAAIVGAGWPRNVANDHLETGLPALPPEEGDVGTVSFGLARLKDVTQPIDLEADEPAPAEGAAAPEGADAVQDTALNGAQIASLLEVVLMVASGELNPDSAKATLLASFPTLKPEEVDALVDPAAAQAEEKPASPKPPSSPPPPPGKPEGGAAADPSELELPDRGARAFPAISIRDAGRRRRLRVWMDLAVRVYAPRERAFLALVRKHFRRVGEDVLGELRGGRSGSVLVRMTEGELDEYLKRKRAEWDEYLKRLAGPEYKRTARSAIDALLRQLGGPTEFGVSVTTPPAVLEFLKEKEIRLAHQVNDTLVKRVKGALVEGLGEKKPVTALALDLERELGVEERRARMIARSEVGQAANGARFECTQVLAAEDPHVKGREWTTAGDERVRHSHVALDGVVVPVTGGVYANGCRFPCDPDGEPEEIIQCRCAEGLVMDI
jgi:HK97 family phage portal protein